MIKASAEENNRSMNAEIVYRLEWSLFVDDEHTRRFSPKVESLKNRFTKSKASHQFGEDEAQESLFAGPTDLGDAGSSRISDNGNVGFLDMPEGVTAEDLADALYRANQKAFAQALRELGIVQKPFPVPKTDEDE